MASPSEERSIALIQRKIVKAGYEKAGTPYLVNSRPYESTLPIKFDFVQGPQITPGAAPSGITTGFLVARANQILEFFGYGRTSNGAGVGAIADDTNIASARKTNANEDFVIEGVSMTHRSTRFAFAPLDIGAWTTSDPLAAGAYADADVSAALAAGAPAMFDPSALFVPLVAQSPAMLEDGLYNAIAPHLFMEFVWGGKRTEQIGCLDNVPEGAAKSLLRANGLPSTDNRMKVPEGYLWRSRGADEDFVARATLARAVVIPIAGTIWPALDLAAGIAPKQVFVDLKLRLHGVAFSYPSRN